MRFEPGKFYKHTGGCGYIATLDFMETTMFGRTLIVETCGNQDEIFMPVGTDSDDYAINWVEVTKKEWLANFTKE